MYKIVMTGRGEVIVDENDRIPSQEQICQALNAWHEIQQAIADTAGWPAEERMIAIDAVLIKYGVKSLSEGSW